MTDREFLIWLHQRLVKVHGESKYVDYMHFLRDIIYTTPTDRRSRGDTVTMHSTTVQDEIEEMERVQSKTPMNLWMHTSGGNHLSKRRRIAKRKKALVAMLRRIVASPSTAGRE